jgi:hypothetical protein
MVVAMVARAVAMAVVYFAMAALVAKVFVAVPEARGCSATVVFLVVVVFVVLVCRS